MSTLPYSTANERSTSRARSVAGAVTGAAGAWLALVSWQAQRWGLVALGLIGCLACVGWWIAARRGRRRVGLAQSWRLIADEAGVRASGSAVTSRSWSQIAEVHVDEETLEVVLDGPPEATDIAPLRIAPCWGGLGAYQLAEWLEAQRPARLATSARHDESD